MSHGRIVDFSKPGNGTAKSFTRVEQTRRGSAVEVIDSNSKQQAQPVELRVHEEVIVQSENGPRNVKLKKDGTPDLRFRNAPTQKEWDKIKRLTWEEK